MTLTLCKEDGKAELNKLQTGFQLNMGCMMTAFMVRVLHRNSTVARRVTKVTSEYYGDR